MINDDINYTDAQMLRMKAEENLKAKKIVNPVMEADVNKLLHELQVHQIELEMQGEELQKAYEMAELSLKKYTMLFDLAPIGYFILNSDGSICDLNFTGAEMLHERRFSLLNSNFKLFVSDKSKLEFSNFLDEVFTGISKHSCHIELGYDHNPLGNVYIEGIINGDDHTCLLSVVDISAFK